MSHIPLLAKHAPPRLQSPRRGPQVCCLCCLLGIVLLVAQPPLYSYAYNATHSVDVPAPPPELYHVLDENANRIDDTPDMRGMMHDLLVTVRYLAKRALASR